MRSPGLHFREIQRRLHLANGALEHHLRTLLRSGSLESERDGQFVRFYPPPIRHEERVYISILRQPRLREIITFLILRPGSDYRTIAQELNLSPSTITWHLKRLQQVGVVTRGKKNDSELICFQISEPERLTKILSAYRQSFLDKAVDSFLDTWENL